MIMRDITDFCLMDDLPSDCFDMLVASFAKWIKNEYRFLYIGCLGVKINTEGKNLGDILIIDKGDILDNALKNGMAAHIHPVEGLTTEMIHKLLNHLNPLMLELDEYDCWWRKNYLKIHRFHYILIHHFVAKEAVFDCTDTYPTHEHLYLSMVFVQQCGKRILCFRDKGEPPQKPDIGLHLLPLVHKYQKQKKIGSAEGDLNWLATHITELDISLEVKGFQNVDILYIPVIWKLKNIQWSYKQLYLLLTYLGLDQSIKLNGYITKVSANWEIITNVMSLSIIRKTDTYPVRTLQENLRKVVYYEELLFECLRHIYENGNSNYYSSV